MSSFGKQEAFNNKVSITDPAPTEGQGVVAVAIEITTPGVVVSHTDGRTKITGDTVVFLVEHQIIMQTPEQEAPQDMMKGFQSK